MFEFIENAALDWNEMSIGNTQKNGRHPKIIRIRAKSQPVVEL